MKMLIWTEEKTQRPILTGAGLITPERGDTVMVVVLEKWSDKAQAIEKLRQLVEGTDE